MQEVKSRVLCSTEGCLSELEYWATLDIEMRDTSDTFQSISTPEVKISGPDFGETGWTSEGGWTVRYFCPICSVKNAEAAERKKSRAKKKDLL